MKLNVAFQHTVCIAQYITCKNAHFLYCIVSLTQHNNIISYVSYVISYHIMSCHIISDHISILQIPYCITLLCLIISEEYYVYLCIIYSSYTKCMPSGVLLGVPIGFSHWRISTPRKVSTEDRCFTSHVFPWLEKGGLTRRLPRKESREFLLWDSIFGGYEWILNDGRIL